MVAAIARYHRRGLPKKRHESWQLIEGREEKRTVGSLALLLRLAAALDRRPAGVIERISLEPEGPPGEPSGFRLMLHPLDCGADQPAQDLSLECWSLLSCADTVREATGLQLSVAAADERIPPVAASVSARG